jgi:hypothetical protein
MQTKIKATIFINVILSFLLFTGASGKNNSNSSTKSTQSNDTLVVTARLIEIPGTFPPNDLYNYVYVMKYRVLNVLQGSYHEREILVGQYNPLISRKDIDDKMADYVMGNVEKFKEGDKHKLKLITPISDVWNKAIEDEYFDTDLVKYYAVGTYKID